MSAPPLRIIGRVQEPLIDDDERAEIEERERRRKQQGRHEGSKAKCKPSRGGRFKTINQFCDFSLVGLERAEIATWFLLWRDTKEGVAMTSQADLARRAGASERTIRRAVAKLLKLGLLSLGRRGGINRGASSYLVRPLVKDH